MSVRFKRNKLQLELIDSNELGLHFNIVFVTSEVYSGVNASSRLGGTSLVSRLFACLTEANWWRLITE